MIKAYLNKRRFLPMQDDRPIDPSTKAIIVIPAHRETFLDNTLLDLDSHYSKDYHFEVIVVLNHARDCSSEIKHFHENQYTELANLNKKLAYPLIVIKAFDLPSKKAGVGLARKIGMDEAAGRFAHIDKLEGIVLCLDADSLVSTNYIKRICDHFNQNPKTEAIHCNFEHRLDVKDAKIKEAIVDYELHLRYYRHAKKYTGHPYVMYTIGSCIGVTATAYAAEGGMPVRKAGEDFYFLNKFLSKGKVDFLPDVFVYPSSRISDRVPFGTGRAMLKANEGENSDSTYAFKPFAALKIFYECALNSFRSNEESDVYPEEFAQLLTEFEAKTAHVEKMNDVRNNAASEESFRKRFFQYMDHFRLMKFIHFARDHSYPNYSLNEACVDLFDAMNMEVKLPKTNAEWLATFRQMDRSM